MLTSVTQQMTDVLLEAKEGKSLYFLNQSEIGSLHLIHP